MSYYNGKRIFTKIVLNGVPRYAKIMLTIGEEKLEANATLDTLYLTGESATVTNGILNIENDKVSVSNNILIL